MPDFHQPARQRYGKRLEFCSYCPKMCRLACPVANADGRETLIPQNKMATLNHLRHGFLAWNYDFTHLLYACTGCRMCHAFCAHGNEVAETLTFGRAVARRREAAHPALRDYPKRFGRRSRKLARVLRELVEPHWFARGGQVAYLPGCDTIAHTPHVVSATLRLFERIDARFIQIPADVDPCFGYPLWSSGHFDDFRWHVDQQLALISRYSRVVTACTVCVWVARVLLPALGHDTHTEVVHVSEFLADYRSRLPWTTRLPPARYHDPCFLGRNLGVYEPPRLLLGQALETVVEFSWNRENAFCCGGGGLLPLTLPESAAAIARSRLAEALGDQPTVGASIPQATAPPFLQAPTSPPATSGSPASITAGQTDDRGRGREPMPVVTACPGCQHLLGGAAGRRLQVRDLVEVVEEATRPRGGAGRE